MGMFLNLVSVVVNFNCAPGCGLQSHALPELGELGSRSRWPGKRVCGEGGLLVAPVPGAGGGGEGEASPSLCGAHDHWWLLCLQRSHCVLAATSTSWTASSSRLWTATGTAGASSAATATRRWPSAASAAERVSTARTTSSSEPGCRLGGQGWLQAAQWKGGRERATLRDSPGPHNNQVWSPESPHPQTPPLPQAGHSGASPMAAGLAH